jgi:DNA-binding beta-propeller fold protein YncE
MGVSGITQLYAMIMLDEPGEDWARSADDKRLFVTMPAAGKVAVVDLESFEVIDSVEAGARPVRVVVQPDGRYLWVGNDSDKQGESGVTVIDLRTLAVAARIATGPGHHEIAFSSSPSRRASPPARGTTRSPSRPTASPPSSPTPTPTPCR